MEARPEGAGPSSGLLLPPEWALPAAEEPPTAGPPQHLRVRMRVTHHQGQAQAGRGPCGQGRESLCWSRPPRHRGSCSAGGPVSASAGASAVGLFESARLSYLSVTPVLQCGALRPRGPDTCPGRPGGGGGGCAGVPRQPPMPPAAPSSAQASQLHMAPGSSPRPFLPIAAWCPEPSTQAQMGPSQVTWVLGSSSPQACSYLRTLGALQASTSHPALQAHWPWVSGKGVPPWAPLSVAGTTRQQAPQTQSLSSIGSNHCHPPIYPPQPGDKCSLGLAMDQLPTPFSPSSASRAPRPQLRPLPSCPGSPPHSCPCKLASHMEPAPGLRSQLRGSPAVLPRASCSASLGLSSIICTAGVRPRRATSVGIRGDEPVMWPHAWAPLLLGAPQAAAYSPRKVMQIWNVTALTRNLPSQPWPLRPYGTHPRHCSWPL